MTPPRPLLLVPVGVPGPDAALLARLAGDLARRLRTACELAAPVPVPDDWWDPERGRLSSNRVVDALVERFPVRDDAGAGRVLAVTELELVAPGRGCVFGEATLGGHWALVGLHRLRPPAPAKDLLLSRRLLTEALHEIGHLAGLEHCSRPDCLMFPSRDVHDTDRKGPRLCDACAPLAPDLAADLDAVPVES